MIKAVIIDDVEKARIALKSDLEHYCREVVLVGEADGVESGMEIIRKTSPDLIFLDIRMADGTGFDLIEKLKKDDVKFQVIFTTAYNEYAIKAFKFSAVDYLLKTVDPEELVQAVKKVKTDAPSPNFLSENLNVLLENMKSIQTSVKRIALNSIDKVQVVAINDIIQCESQRNYTLFYLINNKQVLVTKTLKEYEEMLEEFGFLRVHHSHLINLKHLKEYVKIDGGYAIMSDNSQVPVSVRKREHLLKILGI